MLQDIDSKNTQYQFFYGDSKIKMKVEYTAHKWTVDKESGDIVLFCTAAATDILCNSDL